VTVSEKGFSLIELIVVLTMVAIIVAFAAPSVVEWRQNANYNNISYRFIGLLRHARSQAIASKREHRVEFEVTAGRYRLTRGDRAVGSTVYNSVVQDWVDLASPLAIRANNDCLGTADINFTFASDGTGTSDGASNAVCVMEDPLDGSPLIARSRISLTSTVTGRVVMDKP